MPVPSVAPAPAADSTMLSPAPAAPDAAAILPAVGDIVLVVVVVVAVVAVVAPSLAAALPAVAVAVEDAARIPMVPTLSVAASMPRIAVLDGVDAVP